LIKLLTFFIRHINTAEVLAEKYLKLASAA